MSQEKGWVPLSFVASSTHGKQLEEEYQSKYSNILSFL
jgi:hypothetical protein